MDNISSYFQFEIADNEQAHSPRVHYHSNFEVYYLCNGSCRYFIESKTYTLSAGDIVVIPPGAIHKVIYETDTHSRLLFNCSADYIPASVSKYMDDLAYFPHSPEIGARIENLYKRLRRTVEQPDEFSEDTIRCYVMQLFLTMARNCAVQQLPTDSSFVESALTYIRSNYTSKLTLAEAAKHCAVSPEHLSRVFKKETGFGFNEYLNILRLKKAEAILKSDSNKSIAQVALLCGFNDSNYFSNVFKKNYGISPSKVKQQEENEYVF